MSKVHILRQALVLECGVKIPANYRLFAEETAILGDDVHDLDAVCRRFRPYPCGCSAIDGVFVRHCGDDRDLPGICVADDPADPES